MSYRVRAARARKAREIYIQNVHFVMVLITIAAVLLTAMTVFRFSSHAQAESDHPAYKYYTSVTVSTDHSLDDIAAENSDPAYYRSVEDYLEEVAQINHLAVEDGAVVGAVPGAQIIVPYYSYEFK